MPQSETKLLQELQCVVGQGGIEAASGNTAPTLPPASCQLATQVHSAAETPGKNVASQYIRAAETGLCYIVVNIQLLTSLLYSNSE